MPGTDEYTITFLVSYESSVVLLAPYPNPSPSSMLFTVVISGQEPPDYFGIRIYNMDGRLVREIHRSDDMFVGTNEIIWDGMSDSGAYLPGGVYPYRIVLRRDGSEIPVKVPLNTSYFRGGYGKVVLIR
jgi:flagellar hook assembly protein FlgD